VNTARWLSAAGGLLALCASSSRAEPALTLLTTPPQDLTAEAAATPTSDWSPPGDSTGRAAALEAALAEARDAEEAFDLTLALDRYLGICLAGPPDHATAPWVTACADAARVAFGMDDDGSVDQALGALLLVDPGHDLTGARFAPDLAARAARISARQPRGDLRIDGRALEISIDGRQVGAAPLVLADAPAGDHRIGCNGWQRTVYLPADGQVEITCPIPRQAQGVRQGLTALDGRGLVWIQAPAGTSGMESGLWVFSTDEGVTGVRVHQPDARTGTWERAAAGARRR